MRQFSTIYSTVEVICIQSSGLSMTGICSHNISNQNWLLGPGDCKQSSFICLMHQMHTKLFTSPCGEAAILDFQLDASTKSVVFSSSSPFDSRKMSGNIAFIVYYKYRKFEWLKLFCCGDNCIVLCRFANKGISSRQKINMASATYHFWFGQSGRGISQTCVAIGCG